MRVLNAYRFARLAGRECEIGLNDAVPWTEAVGFVPAKAGETVVSYIGDLIANDSIGDRLGNRRIGQCVGSTRRPVAPEVPTIQPMTSSKACASVPVAGQVNGVALSVLLLLAGAVSSGETTNGPESRPLQWRRCWRSPSPLH